MKLIHNEQEGIVLDHYGDYAFSLHEEFRSVEPKFYQIFDFNPLPMSISDFDGVYIDVNQSFLNLVGFSNKSKIIGKRSSDFNLLDEKAKQRFIDKLVKDGVVTNHSATFKNLSNKKIKGLFSGTIVDLNNKNCLLITCQIVNRKCLTNFLYNMFYNMMFKIM